MIQIEGKNLHKDLQAVLNAHGIDSVLNTPDHTLAGMLLSFLTTFNLYATGTVDLRSKTNTAVPDPTPDPTPEQVAQLFHEAYERLAPEYGYRTREASAKPWAEVPEQNRALMVATCAEVLTALSSPTPVGGGEAPDWLTELEKWLKIQREAYPYRSKSWYALDGILDEIRDGAATGAMPWDRTDD